MITSILALHKFFKQGSVFNALLGFELWRQWKMMKKIILLKSIALITIKILVIGFYPLINTVDKKQKVIIYSNDLKSRLVFQYWFLFIWLVRV